MHTSVIAVVIPVYNAGRFINESIDSARAQTTLQWECMIVDDGSTDETPSRLAAYRDPRIRWIRQGNIGERAARARGVSLTSAPRIVCLDADDRLCPDALLGQTSSRRCLGAVRRSSLIRSIANEYGETIRTESCLRKAAAPELKEVHS